MKKILPVALCLALCLGLLAGCGNQTEAETDEGLLSAVAAVKDYLGGSLYQVEPMPDQETIEVNGERYYLMLVTAVAGDDSVAMEPAIAVKQSDSSLWAYYPDGTLEAVEADSVLYDVSDQPEADQVRCFTFYEVPDLVPANSEISFTLTADGFSEGELPGLTHVAMHLQDGEEDVLTADLSIDDWKNNAATVTWDLNDIHNPEGGIYILTATCEEFNPNVVVYGSADMIVTPAE